MPKTVFIEDFYEKVYNTEMFYEILNKEGFNFNLPIDVTFVRDFGIFYEQLFFCLN